MAPKHLLRLSLMGLAALWLTACSSTDDELIGTKTTVVTDPVSYEVTGVEGEVGENVVNALNGMAPVSKKRVIFFMREITDNTQNALRAYGYYNPEIKVEMPDRDNAEDVTVKVSVTPGKPVFIRDCDVVILGEGADYKVFQDLLESNGIKSYTVLNHGSYETLKSELKSTALRLGFFDFKIVTSRMMVFPEQNVADIELIVDTKKRYKFGPLVPEDEETKELLKPSEGIKPVQQGENYSSKELNAYTNSLSTTGFYRAVDIMPKVDEAEDLEVPIHIALTRKSDNIMRVGVGYSTDEGPRMLLQWDKPLLNSAGHSLTSSATVSGVTQNANLIYKIPRDNPNLDYYYINALQQHTDLNDTKSDRSHLSFHYVANDSGAWRQDWALKAEYEDYEQGSEEGYSWKLMPAVQFSRRETTGGFDPRYGYSITVGAFGAVDKISDLTFFQTNLTAKALFSPTENTRFLIRAQAGATMGKDALKVPPSMRYFAGGDNSLRGYGYLDEAPSNDGGLKGGRYIATGSLEFQFPCGISSSRLALFLDAGVVTDDYDNVKDDDYLLGPGFGYRFISAYGTLRVDLGFGVDKDPTDIRLHFAFGPEL